MKFHRIKKEFVDLIPSGLDICLLGLQGSRTKRENDGSKKRMALQRRGVENAFGIDARD